MNTPRVFYRTGKFLEIHAPLVFATISVLIYTQVSENLGFGACILSPKGWLLLLRIVEERRKPMSSKYKTFTASMSPELHCKT